MDIETVELAKPVHGGACLSRLSDGRTLFVRGGLPGEIVKVKISSSHKKFAWADVVEVVERSPHRVAHIWPEAEAAGVGGVELGHVAVPYQREWKAQVLEEQLRRIGGPEVISQIEGVVGAEASPLVGVNPTPADADDLELAHRRTRVQLVADQQRRLGMRKFRSHDVVAVESLPIADKALEPLNVFTDPIWDGKWAAGERVSLEAPSDSEAIVVTSTGAYLKDGVPYEGPSVWSVQVGDVRHEFPIRPGAFWQTHREAPQVLVRAVLEGAAVQPDDVVLELYSGSGLFTAFLVDQVVGGTGSVLSLEGNTDAVRSAGGVLTDAIEAGTAQIFSGTVDASGVAELAEQAGAPVTTVVLDPPRTGAGAAVVKAIAATGARRVVLVSCDPAAGSRDLADLVKEGFRITAIQAWDLFPHTHHFEMVTVLVKED